MQSSSNDLNRINQLRVINLAPCDLEIHPEKFTYNLTAKEPVYNKNTYYNIPTEISDEFFKNSTSVMFKISGVCDQQSISQTFEVTNQDLPKNLIFSLNQNQMVMNQFKYNQKDQVYGTSQAKVKSLLSKEFEDKYGNISFNIINSISKYNNLNITSINDQKSVVMSRAGGGGISKTDPTYYKIDYATYNFEAKGQDNTLVFKAKDILFETCGRYTILLFQNLKTDKLDFVFLTDIYPSGISIFWQLIQIFVMTIGEIMFSISGLAFAYSQAPPSMKSVLQSVWQLTVAFGNLIVVIIAEAKFVDNQVYEYLLFAGLLGIATIAFGVLAWFYKYEDPDASSEKEEKRDGEKQDVLTQFGEEKAPLDFKPSKKVGVQNDTFEKEKHNHHHHHNDHKYDVDNITRLNAMTDEILDKF
jgi:hypothetical protein